MLRGNYFDPGGEKRCFEDFRKGWYKRYWSAAVCSWSVQQVYAVGYKINKDVQP